MRRKAFGVLVTLFTISVLFAACLVSGADDEARISRPFEYRGFTAPEYDGYVKTSEYVEMSDGTKLAVDIFLPSGGPSRQSFPTVFHYTPYSRSYIHPSLPWWGRLLAKLRTGSAGPVFDAVALESMPSVLLAHGYAFAVADMRGTGASFGWKMDFTPVLADDGRALVDWIAQQSWSDGRVGMSGKSYLGWAQIVTAARRPEALNCIIPEVSGFDGYSDLNYPGGIYNSAFKIDSTRIMKLLESNSFDVSAGVLPATPVVDEDADGDLVDEIPIDLDGSGSFLDDYRYPEDPMDPPRYSDGQPRKHYYFLATREHRENIDFEFYTSRGLFIDGRLPPPFSHLTSFQLSPSGSLPDLMKSDVAVYHMGGWLDGFSRGILEMFATMKDAVPTKVSMGAGYHNANGPYWEYSGEDEDEVARAYDMEKLRFFDHCLKRVDNGIDRESPVTIYRMKEGGGGWRSLDHWPPRGQVPTPFYFGAGNALSTERTLNQGADTRQVDLTHDSRFGDERIRNRWLALDGVSPDRVAVRTGQDKKSLTYTSDPLENDVEVTGHPIVRMWVSSTADDGDFFVYLVDVDEAGESVYVTEGELRAGFAALHDNGHKVLAGSSGLRVLPELPWHGYERSHYVDRILADNSIVKLEFDLLPTSWVFPAGHRIRISIAGSDWPTFRLHPKLAPSNRLTDVQNPPPLITVHRDEEHPSHVQVPIIPPQRGYRKGHESR